MKSMPIFTGLTQLETTTNPEVLPSLSTPLLHPHLPHALLSLSHIIPTSPPHLPRPSLLPSSNFSAGFKGFPHVSALQIKSLPGRRKEAGRKRRGGYWFNLWSPFMKTQSPVQNTERWLGVEECCCVLRLKVIDLHVFRVAPENVVRC